jgi:hypothetical protein
MNVIPAKTEPAPLMIISHWPPGTRRRRSARTAMMIPLATAQIPKTVIAAARLASRAIRIPPAPATPAIRLICCSHLDGARRLARRSNTVATASEMG